MDDEPDATPLRAGQTDLHEGGAASLREIQLVIGEHARRSWPDLTVPIEGLALAEEGLELMEALAGHLASVCRAIVKSSHGNRGDAADWDTALAKELADTVLVACNLATLKHLDLGQVVERRVAEVIRRDLDHDPVAPGGDHG